MTSISTSIFIHSERLFSELSSSSCWRVTMSRRRTDSRESKEIRAIIICRGQSDKKAREVHLLAHRGVVGARSLATLGGEMERKSELGRGRGHRYKPHCFVNNVACRVFPVYLPAYTRESANNMHSCSIMRNLR